MSLYSSKFTVRMFQITQNGPGGIVRLSGILDGSQVDEARRVFETITSSCDVDFGELRFISSAGLGLLLATQKRLAPQGERLRLVNMPNHLRKIFDLTMFGVLFEIH
jgi:anti-sigma B factor antagonist